MPNARVRMAMAVKPGVRASMRKEYCKSRTTVSSQLLTRVRRRSSLAIGTGTPRLAPRGTDEKRGKNFDENERGGTTWQEVIRCRILRSLAKSLVGDLV